MATAVEIQTDEKPKLRRKNVLLDELRPLNPEKIVERIRSWPEKEANKVLDSYSGQHLKYLLLIRIGIMKAWPHREPGQKADLEKYEKDLPEMTLTVEVKEGRYYSTNTFVQLRDKLNRMDTVVVEGE